MSTDLKKLNAGSPKRGRRLSRKAISYNTRALLWARAAGRCQYRGCNRSVIGDLLSGSPTANLAAIAHIIADSEAGPRGDRILSPKLSICISNLMLLCDGHHRIIDSDDRVHDHPVERLAEMKRVHEQRVALVTEVIEEHGCHVIRYAARIGENESPVNRSSILQALLPDRYAVEGGWIDLDVVNLDLSDDDPAFWKIHLKNLRQGYAEKVRGRMERGEIKRLAVFGLAPMPLLFELGRLISDISDAEVRQLFRNPKGWGWETSAGPIEFRVTKPANNGRVVGLKLEISAAINDDRLSALGDVPIWSIAALGAHNDIIRRPDDLAAFAKVFRRTLDAIKSKHGEDVDLHVFPAVPVSAAIEAGRSWQPKAHPSFTIYDQNRTLGGFVRTHVIRQEV